MCKFKSAIVLKNGDVLHNQWVDSHEELITLNNLNDNGRGDFVRIEYIPQDRMLHEFSKYKLVVDENETPEWFEKHREKVENKMKAIIKNMIISEHTDLIVGRRVIVKPGVNIHTIRFCVIEMLENSQVNRMWENSQVNRMLGNSRSPKKMKS